MTSLYEGLSAEYGDTMVGMIWNSASKQARWSRRNGFTGAERYRAVMPTLPEHRDMIIAEVLASPKVLLPFPSEVEKRVRRAAYFVEQEIRTMIGEVRDGVPLEVLGDRAPHASVQRRCGKPTRSGRPCLTWVPCRHHA